MKNGKEIEFAENPCDKLENWMTTQRYATDLPKQYGEAFYFCNSCRTCIEPQILLFGTFLATVDDYRNNMEMGSRC